MLPSQLDRKTFLHFKRVYRDSRQHVLGLLDAFPTVAWRASFTLQETSPTNDALATDCAWIGPEDASRVLVLTSGTHGVEGYAGSAIQADFLANLNSASWALPENTAVLLVHALNPWGMAWLRRCDQQGIDLNRNFVDFSKPLPANPGYDELRDCLMGHDDPQPVLDVWRAQHGQAALETAISGGQYTDMTGPFYGGTAPAFANRLIHQLIDQHELAQRRLAVIDLHTGLGPYGYGEVICDHAPNTDGARTAHAWYGDSVTLPLAGTSSSVPKHGLLDFAWHAIMNPDSCFVTLEFGSYSVDALFQSILADHRLHAAAQPDLQTPESLATKQQLLQHFCPDDDQWRELVLLRARQVIRMALLGLSQ